MVADGPVIQVFGRKDSQATRHCLRYFKERRVDVSFVDVARRAPAPTELRRFSRRFGARAMLDEEGSPYRRAGLGYVVMDDEEILERLVAEPHLLRLPLVRRGSHLSIGVDEAVWRSWLVPNGQ